MSSSDTTSNVGMARLRSRRLGAVNGRPDTVRGPGSVPEWPKGAGCKPAAQATLVRIQPGPLTASTLRSVRASSCEPCGASVRSRQSMRLHLDHVEPLAELPADLPLGAHDLEAAGRVQRDRRRRCSPGDAGDHRVEAVRPRPAAAAPRAARRPMPRPWWPSSEVDRVLDRRARRRAGAGSVESEPNPTTAARRARPRRRDGRRSARRSTGTCSSRVRGTRSKSAVDSVT